MFRPDHPLWSAGFRPFFLGGAIYGPLVILSWLASHAGIAPLVPFGFSPGLWHAHELLAGYGTAVITGFVITGIPSWGECPAIERHPLMALFAVWLAGRAALWATPVIGTTAGALVDLLYFPLLALLAIPGLRQSRYRAFYGILPILAAFFAANLAFHAAIIAGDAAGARLGMEAFLYTIIVLYTLVGGFLAPIFTETELRAAGTDITIPFLPLLEGFCLLAVLAYAASGLMALPGPLAGTIAGITLALHLFRFWRWRGWRCGGHPLLWVIHLSYLWFLTSVGLRGLADLGFPVPAMAAVHAFTVGAFGLMKIGFMTRVALRHTGRVLSPGAAMVTGFWLMLAAAAVRLGAAFGYWPGALMAASSILWAAPFLIYLTVHGPMLAGRSLPAQVSRPGDSP